MSACAGAADVVKKLGQYLVVLAAAITLNFALPRFIPGDPLVLLAGESALNLSPETQRAILGRAGLDRPLWEQYGRFLGELATGDLGFSYLFKRPVRDVLAERMPWTLLLAGGSLILSAVLGTLLGALAAWYRARPPAIALYVGAVVSESMPAFWVGMLLLAIFAGQLRLLPSFGARSLVPTRDVFEAIGDLGAHLVLPLATLVLVRLGSTFLLVRAAMLEVLREEYVRVARAKGLGEGAILFGHALRNAMLPAFTAFMLGVGTLLGGATVVETVFSYPGVGRLVYEAVLGRDYPTLQAAFLIITITVVTANAVADLAYPLIDPRVRRRA